MPTKFADIQMILDAIADENGGLSRSKHQAFWRQKGTFQSEYEFFKNGNVVYKSNPNGVPIMNLGDPKNSNFFVILTNPKGLEDAPGKPPPMPLFGPYITEQGYTVTLSNKKTMTGDEIIKTISDWLEAGYPE